MDGLSIVLALANLIALTDNIYRGVKFIREGLSDPGADDLYVRLLTEKARFAEWKNRMGIDSTEDLNKLLEKLSADNQKALLAMLRPLLKHSRTAQDLADEYALGSTPSQHGSATIREKMKRLNFRFHGADQLSALLQTLKSCNDGLITIAPPPPGYYVNADPIIATGDSISVAASQNTIPVSSRISTQNIRASTVIGDNTSDQGVGQDGRVFRPLIELLHSTCMDALRNLIIRFPTLRKHLEGIGDRLALWGSGLFQSQITIDQAVNDRSNASALLKDNICGTLADIVLILGKWDIYLVMMVYEANISFSSR